MYEIFEQLLQKNGVTAYKVSKETGVTQSTLSDWKRGRSTHKSGNMKKIADYFGVSVDYLMTGEHEPKEMAPELTARDKRNIAKDLDRIMKEIADGEDSPLYYNDKPIPKNKVDLLRNAIEIALEDAKVKNKETYRPYKHKPRPEKE